MNKEIPIVTATIVPEQDDDNQIDIVICRRCQLPFNRNMSVSPSSAAYYRCQNCLTLSTFTHDFMMSCTIQ